MTAADFTWSLVHVDNYRHLVLERDWDREIYTERLVRVAQQIFLKQTLA